MQAGLHGRKSGRGFYAYPPGPPALSASAYAALPAHTTLVVHGSGPVADALAAANNDYLVTKHLLNVIVASLESSFDTMTALEEEVENLENEIAELNKECEIAKAVIDELQGQK